MGRPRPKLSGLSCTICEEKFEKKYLLDEHMKNHLKRKMKSNVSNDLFSCENGFVLFSKKKMNKKVDLPQQQPLTVKKIKTKSADNDDSDWLEQEKAENKKSKQKKILKVKFSQHKCSLCGLQCKGEKGLKIHMSVHKKQVSYDDDDSENENYDYSENENYNDSENQNDDDSENQNDDDSENQNGDDSENGNDDSENENDDDSESDDDENYDLGQSLTDKNTNNSNSNNNPVILSVTGAVNAQSAKPSIKISQIQNQSSNHPNIEMNYNSALNFGNPIKNVVSSANQPDAQSFQSLSNQIIQQTDYILKFDCNSEIYATWLKNFASMCKTHGYPLNPEICKKISLVTEEIQDALCNPDIFLRQKEKHLYFMRMYDILSEIKLKHLQHVMCGCVN